MSIPLPPSQERQSLDQNQKQIAKNLLTLVENLIAFNEFVKGIPSDPEALTEAPYGYTADQAYALRLWAEKAQAYADLFDDGGTFDAGPFEELTRRSAGVIVFQPSGF